MAIMKFLIDATNQTYNAEALGYIANLEGNVKDTAPHLDIFAGIMAKQRIIHGVFQ